MRQIFFLLKIEENPEKIRQALNSILSERQFAGLYQGKSTIARILEWLSSHWIVKKVLGFIVDVLDFIKNLFLGNSGFLYVTLFVLLVFIIAFIIISIRRKILKSTTKNKDGEEGAGSIDPNIREQQGIAAAKTGNFTEAIRQLYISLLLFFNLKGILEYNPSRTNRETERLILEKSKEEFKNNFSRLNRIFEDKVYALNPCDSAEFREFREAYEYCRKGIDRF